MMNCDSSSNYLTVGKTVLSEARLPLRPCGLGRASLPDIVQCISGARVETLEDCIEEIRYATSLGDGDQASYLVYVHSYYHTYVMEYCMLPHDNWCGID